MDTRDGSIHYLRDGEVEKLDLPYLVPMEVPPTARQRARMKVGRNENCPCGSGKKFKRCCMFRIQRGEGLRTAEDASEG